MADEDTKVHFSGMVLNGLAMGCSRFLSVRVIRRMKRLALICVELEAEQLLLLIGVVVARFLF